MISPEARMTTKKPLPSIPFPHQHSDYDSDNKPVIESPALGTSGMPLPSLAYLQQDSTDDSDNEALMQMKKNSHQKKDLPKATKPKPNLEMKLSDLDMEVAFKKVLRHTKQQLREFVK